MKRILPLLSIVVLFSCKQAEKKETESTSALKPKVSLHIFDGGTVVANNLELFSEDTTYHGQTKTLADAFYVIQHPKGNLMWDGGLPESLVAMKEPYTDPSGAFTVSRKDSVINQLKTIGLTPDDFDYLALSHSHFDHVGHAYAFKNSTWLVQENEYEFFTNDSARVQQPDIYNAIKDLTKVKKLHGDYDVFGDSTVMIKVMPGHTIGHQVLYVDLGLEKPILLTGDLYHFEENRMNKKAPIFNYDIPMTKKSMEEFEVFAKEHNAEVFIQHSQQDFDRLKKLLNL